MLGCNVLTCWRLYLRDPVIADVSTRSGESCCTHCRPPDPVRSVESNDNKIKRRGHNIIGFSCDKPRV
ncbi:hypothetical protein Dsin_027655 [Dipteronia sinensis]|uniref:Uncharacterized protein n=1 Tax=Dipteronia sinensis TaxID=43782 RepID=A0AAE0DTU6_9ROSI|nr:hypothetical protein Dsin_027655 [Dipteronia sinensis]